jgi:hypothetical protein
LKKRKQKKGQNLSIHRLDEALQKSIQDAVLQNLTVTQDNEPTQTAPVADKQEEEKGGDQK